MDIVVAPVDDAPMHASTPDRDDHDARQTVAVVGGGCAGVLAAIWLLRGEASIEVYLIDPSGQFGSGVAYATSDPFHLLNVPAGRLSTDPDQPDAFTAWARRTHPDLDVQSTDFLPRGTYGGYLADSLHAAERAGASRGSVLRRVTATVTDVAPGDHAGERVVLDDGRRIDVDQVVLALGPPATTRLPALQLDDPAVHHSPWEPGALDPLPNPSAHVVLIGSGLTAVDAAMSLCALDDTVHVTMVSRSAVLPSAHDPSQVAAGPADSPAWPDGPLTVDALVAGVHEHVRATEASGLDWRAAIDSIRPQVPELWQRLGEDGQRAFLRHHAREWEVRRHRMAPNVAARIDELLASGRLRIAVGSPTSVHRQGDDLLVSLGADATSLRAARVIACTGPSSDVATDGPPLARHLLATGRLAPDALGLGVRADHDGRVIDLQGATSTTTWLLGALRRGELYETTAVAEIRAQAVRIAARATVPRS